MSWSGFKSRTPGQSRRFSAVSGITLKRGKAGYLRRAAQIQGEDPGSVHHGEEIGRTGAWLFAQQYHFPPRPRAVQHQAVDALIWQRGRIARTTRHGV